MTTIFRDLLFYRIYYVLGSTVFWIYNAQGVRLPLPVPPVYRPAINWQQQLIKQVGNDLASAFGNTALPKNP
ncbi:MAG: hypothetical protein ACI9WS_002545 [Paraglaciecola psychrophila]